MIPGDAQDPGLGVGMAGDRIPMGQGPGEGLGGGVLGRGPVKGASQQRPEDWAAVVLVEQPERLQRVDGHLTSPSASDPLGRPARLTRAGLDQEMPWQPGSGLVRRKVEPMHPSSRVLPGSRLMGLLAE